MQFIIQTGAYLKVKEDTDQIQCEGNKNKLVCPQATPDKWPLKRSHRLEKILYSIWSKSIWDYIKFDYG
jgi:hypothetical protein